MKQESEKLGLKLNIEKMKIMASSPITSWQIDGETMATMTDFIFLDSKITVDGEWSHNINRYFLLERKSMTNLDSVLKKQRYYFVNKDTYSQSSGFSSSHIWMWELDQKESWESKNWCFQLWYWRRLESPLDCKEIKSVQPKGNQSWIFIGRTECWSWNSNTSVTWCEGLAH